MKRLITYSCMAIFAMGSMAQNQKDEAQMNRFISGLMKKMTLEEKVGQLSQCPYAGSAYLCGQIKTVNCGLPEGLEGRKPAVSLCAASQF